eukprot:TRINITY_DN108_c0_g1_i1.p1 TRINITY_DN108_c0_g1~~TRINITY_DN108_c0_g1_i1.p1  ORF type:complete len:285 (-),score=74.99 TRINITY_DN108_c0_g1_i1:41-895(-)
MFSQFARRSRGKRVSGNRFTSTKNLTQNKKLYWALGASAVLGVSAYTFSSTQQTKASDLVPECAHPPEYPWHHSKPWGSYDHSALRRGYQVYHSVAAACHSMEYIYYRNFVNVLMTEEEAKALALDADEIIDGTFDSEGEPVERPRLLSDPIPAPYANEEQARDTNNGAYPPDLSLIAKNRHGYESYIMALLTGYRDPPAGIELGENMYYNIYFPGCQLAMPPPLVEGSVEYDDGTEASISQMAKDVSVFLAWAANPEHAFGNSAKKTILKAHNGITDSIPMFL